MTPITGIWTPAYICVFISLAVLLGPAMFPSFDFGWRAVFFGILPLCFYKVGSKVWRVNRNMERLRDRLEPLEH